LHNDRQFISAYMNKERLYQINSLAGLNKINRISSISSSIYLNAPLMLILQHQLFGFLSFFMRAVQILQLDWVVFSVVCRDWVTIAAHALLALPVGIICSGDSLWFDLVFL